MAPEPTAKPEWSIEGAEALLNSLKGVVSARIVARPGGVIEEIHVLTEGEVQAKQTVRNVESALLAHFGLEIDHRKVSVAQTAGEQEAAVEAFQWVGSRRDERRFLFVTHRVETGRGHQVRTVVTLEWGDEQYEGDATGADGRWANDCTQNPSMVARNRPSPPGGSWFLTSSGVVSTCQTEG